MKKFVLFGILAVVGIVGILAGVGYMSVRANESALEEIRGQEGVHVLSVSGMT